MHLHTAIEDAEYNLCEVGSLGESENVVPMNNKPVVLIVLLQSADWSEIFSDALSEDPLSLVVVPSGGGDRSVDKQVRGASEFTDDIFILFVVKLTVFFSTLILEFHASALKFLFISYLLHLRFDST